MLSNDGRMNIVSPYIHDPHPLCNFILDVAHTKPPVNTFPIGYPANTERSILPRKYQFPRRPCSTRWYINKVTKEKYTRGKPKWYPKRSLKKKQVHISIQILVKENQKKRSKRYKKNKLGTLGYHTT